VNAFELVGSSGSHQKWRHPVTGKQVIVSHHRGRILPLGTMRASSTAAGSNQTNGSIDADRWAAFERRSGRLQSESMQDPTQR